MTASKDSLRHTFGYLDTRLVPAVMAVNEQWALRLVTTLVLTAYALLGHDGPMTALTASLLVLLGYALLQFLLSLLEIRLNPGAWRSILITALDLLLFGWQLGNDPLNSLPTLLLGTLVVGLAALRWSSRSLWLILLATISVGALGIVWHAYRVADVAWPLLIIVVVASLIVISMMLVMAQLARHHLTNSLNAPGRDPATGLFNRPTLYAAAELLMPLMHRQHQPLTLLYVVLEPTGLAPGREPGPTLTEDLCREFADIARSRLRGSDILIRYSSLEFVFLLLDCPSTQADPIAHDLQERFHASRASQQSPATAHIGATWLPSEPMALDQLLDHLDEAMVRARRSRIGVSGAIYSDPEQARHGHQLNGR